MEHSQGRLPARLEVGQEAEQARRPGRLWGWRSLRCWFKEQQRG